MDSTFNIISFDGGGIRGALSIKLLEKIKTLNPNIVKNANMISGTSTGSLIALGLAYGISAEEISNLYSKENLEYIFDKCGKCTFSGFVSASYYRYPVGKIHGSVAQLSEISDLTGSDFHM